MIYEWQQPLRRLDYRYISPDGDPVTWKPVLFIRALDNGYEIMGINGNVWRDRDVVLREATV